MQPVQTRFIGVSMHFMAEDSGGFSQYLHLNVASYLQRHLLNNAVGIFERRMAREMDQFDRLV